MRGGYTRPRAFTLSQELGIFDNARASIACEGTKEIEHTCANEHKWRAPKRDGEQVSLCPECLTASTAKREIDEYHRWDTDDGYSFHDESYPTKARYELRKCNVVALDAGETVGDKFKPGTVVVNDETHEGHCPHCAAKLSAWFY